MTMFTDSIDCGLENSMTIFDAYEYMLDLFGNEMDAFDVYETLVYVRNTAENWTDADALKIREMVEERGFLPELRILLKREDIRKVCHFLRITCGCTLIHVELW